MEFIPLHDKVVVKPFDEEPTYTRSGLFVSQTHTELPRRGIVISVGKGKFSEDGLRIIPLTVKEGDTVLFQPFGGHVVKIGDQDHRIMKEEDIYAIIR